MLNLTDELSEVKEWCLNQAFSQTLKTGLAEGMFSHKITRDYVNFLTFLPKMGVHRTPGCPSGYNLGLNQFGKAVLGWCSESVKPDRLVEFLSNLTLARHTGS